MGKRAFITGVTGQDGAYLAKLLLEKGYEVHGLVRRVSTPSLWRLEELGIAGDVRTHEGDLTDESSLQNALREAKPGEIYNLAAQSFVGTSWQQPILTGEVNAMGALRLLSAWKQLCPEARFYQASTSEMFGDAKGPLSEGSPFRPRSPYGFSKLFAHWATINHRESFGLFACCGILFNHESPLRGVEFVTRKITDGAARIKAGKARSIRLGNLDARRDWGFAGDYAEAMWRMLQQETPGEFVIATGESRSIRDILDAAFAAVGIADWTPHVETDPSLRRPAEVETLTGDSAKARQALDWEPTVRFERLIAMMVERDLERVSAS